MKKIILPILFIFSASCLPQSGLIPGFKKTNIQLKGDISALDNIEVTVKDINCVNTKPCLNEVFTINNNNISNGINTIPGSKNIIIKQIKDGKVINETSISEEVLLDKVLSINIPKIVVSVSASPSPEITPTATPSLSIPEESSVPTVIPTTSASPSIEPTPTATPTEYTPRGGGGGGGGGGGSYTPPTPQIVGSATVAPDEIGVQ